MPGVDTPLKRAMRAKGKTYRDLAEATDYGLAWLSAVANGHVQPSGRLRRSLARALEVPERELFDGEVR